jgi:TetR/AcrR family transcriptional regulator, regulator of cefoperazone and chloramphenicol sensitivity
MRQSKDGTRRRLIAAASELFAERGFHATTARDIARRAGVNLAAGHYHYGSKKDLYLEVLREQFATIRSVLQRRGGTRPAAEIERLDRAALAQLLRTRIKVMLDMLIGPPPGLHGALMQREMTDPSQALPMIVAEFIDPILGETEQIVARLVPRLGRREVERCAISIVSQAIFYRFAMPLVLHRKGWKSYPAGFGADLSRHIVEFSLGGMERVGARRAGRRRAR